MAREGGVQERIITFESRSEWFGLKASDVREVARLRGVRQVPRAPGLIAGLAEVHGRVVTLIDLDRLLLAGEDGAGGDLVSFDAAAGLAEFGVVLALPYEHLGILVRSEVDVATAPEEQGGDPVGAASWLKARLPVGDRLLNLLSLPALVSRVEDSIRKGFRPRSAGTDGEEA
jgi:chemotaxis signal transduction protein